MSADNKPTLLDRFVAWRDPVKGLQRQQARHAMALMGGYQGASRKGAAFANWYAPGSDANADLLPDLPTLRNRCRDMLRNQPIAGGAINTVVTNVVGSGLILQSTIDYDYLGMSEEEADEWQKNTEREFALFSESKNCDLTRTQDFSGLQDLAFRCALGDGDGFALLPHKSVKGFPYSTRIQMVEGDRVCNKDSKPDSAKNAGGIVLDDDGAPSKLQVLRHHPGGYHRGKKEWNEFDYYGSKTGRINVVHLFDRRRPGQLRGVPYLAAVIEPLKQIARYTEAELVAAVVSGLFTVFIKTEGGAGGFAGPAQIDNGSRNYSLGNGSIIEGVQGDEIQTIDPGRPNKEFDPFITAILKQVAINLEMPFEVLMKNFVSSYSASRAALLEAWRFFKKRRKWLAKYFCQPIYETWLAEAISIGRINAPGFFEDPMIRRAYSKAAWHGDGPGSLDPLKEANAAEKRMDVKLTSLAEEKTAYDGGDWQQTVAQRNRELKQYGPAKEEGLKQAEIGVLDPDDQQ